MQNINKELSLCSQLGTDAPAGGLSACISGGSSWRASFGSARTRMQSSDVFPPSEYCLENKSPNLARVKKKKKLCFLLRKCVRLSFLFLVCLFFFFKSNFRAAGY